MHSNSREDGHRFTCKCQHKECKNISYFTKEDGIYYRLYGNYDYKYAKAHVDNSELEYSECNDGGWRCWDDGYTTCHRGDRSVASDYRRAVGVVCNGKSYIDIIGEKMWCKAKSNASCIYRRYTCSSNEDLELTFKNYKYNIIYDKPSLSFRDIEVEEIYDPNLVFE